MFAIAAALFATSCAQDGLDGSAVKGEEAVVTFAVNAPQIAGTRAFGDGKTANDLYYAVYNESNEVIEAISKMDTPEAINISAQVKLRLVNGNTYSLIFWAENAAGVATVDWDAQTLTYAPTASSVEEYDAFWAYVEPFTVNGAATKNVDLYRPFAQVIIGAADYEAAVAAGLTATETQITVTTPSVMSLVNGATSVPVEHTYAYAALPNEAFPIANHKHMGMNYLLFGADKGMVDIKFEYKGSGAEYSRNMPAVPVQRNYRTIVYGNLLTSQTDFNVEIKPDMDDLDHPDVEAKAVYTWAEFVAAIDAGEEHIRLGDNISNAASYTLTKDVTIDLNGKALEISTPAQMLSTKANATIMNGTIKGKVYAQSGDLKLWDVTLGGTIAVSSTEASLQISGANVSAKDCVINATQAEGSRVTRPFSIQGRSSGTIKFEGCEFIANAGQELSYVNPIKGDAKLELVDCKFTNKKIGFDMTSGAKFENLTLSGNTMSGIDFALLDRYDFEGLTEAEEAIIDAIEADNTIGAEGIEYYYKPSTKVASWDEFTAALNANAECIVLTGNISYDGNYSLQKNVTIILNGNTMEMPLLYIFSQATIKDGTISGKVYARENSNATFDGVKFSGSISDNLSAEGHLQINPSANVYAIDCTFDPTAVSGTQTKPISVSPGKKSGSLKFVNCVVAKSGWSTKYKKQIYINSIGANATLEFTGCDFAGKATNIDIASGYSLSNLELSGNSGGITLEMHTRSQESLNEDADILNAIKANNSGSLRIFYNGGSMYW